MKSTRYYFLFALALGLVLPMACQSESKQRAEADSPAKATQEAEKATHEADKDEQGDKPGAEGEDEEAMSEHAKVMTKETQQAMTPDEAIARLKAGNERFVKGEMVHGERKLDKQVEATGSGQYPFAAVLGCIDSRVPPEIVFDQGIGDIFSGRVAGNFVNKDMIGSLEFATKVAGSKAIVVLGHTSCGAVKGACDKVDLGHINALVSEIQPSVKEVTPEGETCSSKNLDLVNDIAKHNVQRTIDELMEKSDVISKQVEDGEVKVVGALYDVKTGKVTFM